MCNWISPATCSSCPNLNQAIVSMLLMMTIEEQQVPLTVCLFLGRLVRQSLRKPLQYLLTPGKRHIRHVQFPCKKTRCQDLDEGEMGGALDFQLASGDTSQAQAVLSNIAAVSVHFQVSTIPFAGLTYLEHMIDYVRCHMKHAGISVITWSRCRVLKATWFPRHSISTF